MNSVYFVSDNIISPLGISTNENLISLEQKKSGLKQITNIDFLNQPICVSTLDNNLFDNVFSINNYFNKYTKFEKLCIASISKAIETIKFDYKNPDTIFVLSTTKGNVELLNKKNNPEIPRDRCYLWKTAQIIQEYFKFYNNPIIVSNACISGLVAINTAARFIQNGTYKHAVVCGADVLSEFIVSGFNSFFALSQTPCKPFDANRNGLNLGESATTIVLSSQYKSNIEYCNGAVSNDANHISGPSRTAEGLNIAIENASKNINLNENNCFISAHGTATPYNDEMEAIAFNRNKFNDMNIVGLKGYYGHTLGAAGVLETVISMHSLKNNILHTTLGFEKPGVTVPVNIVTNNKYVNLEYCLKVASGFGGCNAAIIFKKNE